MSQQNVNEAEHSELAEKVHAVLRKYLRLLEADQPIPPDADLGSLGLDSMGAINLLMELEQALQVAIPDDLLTEETFKSARSLQEAIRSVDSHRQQP